MKPKNTLSIFCLISIGALTTESSFAQLPGTFTTLNTNSNVLGTGTFGTSPAITTTGAGTRMMWYPRKAAFRAGSVTGNEWNDLTIGNYSVALGQNTTAFGTNSTALGVGTYATGSFTTAFGIGTSAASFGSTALGAYNVGGGNPTTWVASDPLFEIGNGDSLTPANAFKVLKNGNTTVSGSFTSSGSINAAGDINLTGSNSGIFANGTTLFSVNSTTNAVSFGTNRPFSIQNAAASTSPTTGALTVAGGLGVTKALNAGADSYINGLRIGRGSANDLGSIVIGHDSLTNPGMTGSSNIAIGLASLRNDTTGYHNTAIGQLSQYGTTSGRDNSAVGVLSLHANTTGSENNAFGTQSLKSNTTGDRNCAFGSAVLLSNTTGGYNSAFGSNCLQHIIGNNNVGMGTLAGYYQADGTLLGAASNSIYIGTLSQGKNNADFNSIVIGTAATGEGANTTVIGNAATTKTHLYGKTISESIQVNGSTLLSGGTVLSGKVTLSQAQGDIPMLVTIP